MRCRKIRMAKVLHNGNSAKIIFGSIFGRYYVVKRYFKRNTDAFVREREILRLLSHPNVVELFHSGRAQTLIFNFIGRPLREYIEKHSIDRNMLAAYTLQIASALRHMHSMGVVHFDLKPENIIVSGGVVKIIDFGSAKYEGELIKMGDFTPMYTSLEYLIGLRTAHWFKDMWSLGCIFYEMCCHEYLIEDKSAIRVAADIMRMFGSPSESGYSTLDIGHLDFFKIFGHVAPDEQLSHVDQRYRQMLLGLLGMNPLDRTTAERLCSELGSIFQSDDKVGE